MPRRVEIGVVVSDKMDKTRVVELIRIKSHPLYDKVIKKKKKVYVHDEKNESKIGDKVKIIESRPLSKLKRWRLLEVVERIKE
ncbi:MAG: 30S ribosomal protein S17 [Caldiserica bacterium]|nr:MAG: 30S ribosomal protein S17 [Caldisericota bacterium]